jgi:hypothetical protein
MSRKEVKSSVNDSIVGFSILLPGAPTEAGSDAPHFSSSLTSRRHSLLAVLHFSSSFTSRRPSPLMMACSPDGRQESPPSMAALNPDVTGLLAPYAGDKTANRRPEWRGHFNKTGH